MSETNEMTGQEKTRKGLSKKALIIGGIVIAAILAVYLGVSLYYENHFFYKSTVNGISSSNATPEDVMKAVAKKTDGFTLQVKEQSGTETIKPDEVGLKTEDNKKGFEKLLKKQNGFAWIGNLGKSKAYESKVLIAYDKDKLNSRLQTLQDVSNPNVTESEDAKLVYQDGAYAIQPEVYGNHVDMDKLTKLAGDALTNLSSSIDLEKSQCYYMPTLTKDDETLKKSETNLNEKLKMTYTFSGDGVNETIPKETMAGFMSTDDKGEVIYNDDAISAFVKQMAEKYNTAGKPITIKSSWGGNVTVPGGSYGIKIDQSKEVAQIKSDLEAGKDVTRDFNYSQKAQRNPTTYMEVNITAQHVYYIKDGQQVLSSDVVTGNVNKGRGTDPGAWYIQGKQKNAVLRGADYATPVAYWMPFHNGEGFHDATWQPSFGGTYYLIRGSHGCVNLPKSFAATLYATVPAGTPVFVYNMPGTENNAPNVKDAESLKQDIANLVASPITAASESTIAALEKRYSKMAPQGKALVTNYSDLQNARAQLNAIKAGTAAPATDQATAATDQAAASTDQAAAQ
ncbi:MAG: peptidoglycan binding domain-containing protein [Lachnospiraceae bacterium]|nr:peptidoglycan binding domain-containing protein [Lachnospiraceae bacterium]